MTNLSINSQLLDLLLDINDSNKIPPRFRYNLRSPTPNASDVPDLEPDHDQHEPPEVEGALAALREAKAEFDGGYITLDDFKQTEKSLRTIIDEAQASMAPQTLTKLSRITHTTIASVLPSGMPADLVDVSPTGYLTSAHEEEYLASLDNYLETEPPDSHLPLPRPARPSEKEKEKDAQLHNPVSVYNWLRAHSDTKAVTHDVEKEAPAPSANNSDPASHRAKPSPKPPSSASTGSAKASRKRASSALLPKQEPEEELLDEEGYVIAGGSEQPAVKGKRKRENDDAYRPKGGSSKSRKRTKGGSGVALKKLTPEPEAEEEDV